MLTYNLTATGSDSLYESLYKCIKNDILQGKLCAGEKLPSKRSFAKNLGISVITVENAYGQLSDEGYIYSMPKRGFYVSDIDMVANPNTGAKTSADANLLLPAPITLPIFPAIRPTVKFSHLLSGRRLCEVC